MDTMILILMMAVAYVVVIATGISVFMLHLKIDHLTWVVKNSLDPTTDENGTRYENTKI